MGDTIRGNKVAGDHIARDKVGGNKIINIFKVDTDRQRAARNRNNMLQLVWNTWIEGVLKKSLYNEMLIELGMETRPDAVEHPWDMVIKMPDCEPSDVPRGTTMLELFDQSNGRLLILGEPGSGKTTMLLELARLAIERAQEDPSQPIPVVFNLSSWTPKQTIADWLVDELRGKYYISLMLGSSWIENDELMVLLDGLDEVKAENREACAKAINDYHENPILQMAICSRRQEYEALKTPLKMSGAVLIQPLTDQQVNEYLQSAGNELVAIHQLIHRDPELRNLAKTPLILNILVMAYRNATIEHLVDFGTEGDYRKRLFDDYIANMFRRRVINHRYTMKQTISWLKWLACSMAESRLTLFYIEDILPGMLRRRGIKPQLNFRLILVPIYGLIVGLLSALIFGLLFGSTYALITGLTLGPIMGLSIGLSGGLSETNISFAEKLVFNRQKILKGLILGSISGLCTGLLIEATLGPSVGLIAGLLVGLMIGLSMGFATGRAEPIPKPTEKLSFTWQRLRTGLGIGLVFGLLGGFLFLTTFGTIFGASVGRIVGLFGGLIIAVICLFSIGLEGYSSDNRSLPGEGIQASLRYFFVVWLLVGLLTGLLTGLLVGLLGWPIGGLLTGPVTGLLLGLFVGLGYGGEFLLYHFFSRYILHRAGHIPWNLIDFLDYCTDRIFLRRAGGGYIFIHRMLMEHFAAMDEEVK